MVQLSHPYMTTGKTIALSIQIFVGKVMSLLFNMLAIFVIAFLPRNKHLISLLQSLSAVTFKASGIWLQTFHSTGGTDSLRPQQNLVCTRTQEKWAVTPQETESDLPVSVQEPLVEAWVNSRLPRDHGIDYSTSASCWQKSFWKRLPLPLPQFGFRPNYKEGTQPHPKTENWIKD